MKQLLLLLLLLLLSSSTPKDCTIVTVVIPKIIKLEDVVRPILMQVIRTRESLRLSNYNCPSGHSTIGYGCLSGLQRIDSLEAEGLMLSAFKTAMGYSVQLHPHLNISKQYAVATLLYFVGYGNYVNSTAYDDIRKNKFSCRFYYKSKKGRKRCNMPKELEHIWNL